ncbi:hypothetical protein G6F63_015434 [Rhizopus arrhizus]|nr:hypothetical protein G6F63_015434 [Rhizopus arrhizus]
MIASGGLALILADQWIGWGYTYVLMGGLMLLCSVATLLAPEPEHVARAPRSLRAAVGEPLQEFFTRRDRSCIPPANCSRVCRAPSRVAPTAPAPASTAGAASGRTACPPTDRPGWPP